MTEETKPEIKIETKNIVLELPPELMASTIQTRVEVTKNDERYIIMVLATIEGKPLAWANIKIEEFLQLVKQSLTQGQN